LIETNKQIRNKIDKPSLMGANFGSDCSGFFCCDALTGSGCVSITGFRGLTTSHLTRILHKIISNYKIKLFQSIKPSRCDFI